MASFVAFSTSALARLVVFMTAVTCLARPHDQEKPYRWLRSSRFPVPWSARQARRRRLDDTRPITDHGQETTDYGLRTRDNGQRKTYPIIPYYVRCLRRCAVFPRRTSGGDRYIRRDREFEENRVIATGEPSGVPTGRHHRARGVSRGLRGPITFPPHPGAPTGRHHRARGMSRGLRRPIAFPPRPGSPNGATS